MAGTVLYLAQATGWRQAALFVVGIAMGISLYHASFSFTSAWRELIMDGLGAGVRNQVILLAIGAGLFFPALSKQAIFGMPVVGFSSPMGVSPAVGAFLFGVGMQLGDRCACGTLYSTRGGSTRMLVTLMACIVGSVIGTAHFPFWIRFPSWGPVSLPRIFGTSIALIISWLALAGIAALTIVIERRRYGQLVSADKCKLTVGTLLHGPWPMLFGPVSLATLNLVTLVLSGSPWHITSAFALWGAKAISVMGVSVEKWPYWASGANAVALDAPLSRDVASVMNVGIVLGAMLASALAGRYAPAWRASLGNLIAAAIGGLLLGYGSRLAYGANVGAYLGGIVSGSLHGWLWFIFAFLGGVVGTRLRASTGIFDERVEATASR